MGFPAQRAPPFDTRAGETSTAFLARAGARHGVTTSDPHQDLTRTPPEATSGGELARRGRGRLEPAQFRHSRRRARRRGMESLRCGSRVQTGCSPASTPRTRSSRRSSLGSKHALDLVPDPRRGRPALPSGSARAAARGVATGTRAARPWSGSSENNARATADAGCTAGRAQDLAPSRARRVWQTQRAARCSRDGPRNARCSALPGTSRATSSARAVASSPLPMSNFGAREPRALAGWTLQPRGSALGTAEGQPSSL